MKNSNILLVDDDAVIREIIKLGLKRDGYVVSETKNAAELLDFLKTNKTNAILLDLILPDGNGLSLISQIREYTDVPIIVISGKGDLVDKIVGLEMGADDYISKPFQIKELSVRIKAQLRRYHSLTLNSSEIKTANAQPSDKIRFGRWTLDRTRMQVFDEKQESGNLTVKEFRLLEVLVLSPQQVLSREQLLDKSRLDDLNVTDRAIDTQITRIRKKLGDAASLDGIIQPVRGVGYMFTAETEHI